MEGTRILIAKRVSPSERLQFFSVYNIVSNNE
jgi:hypothetical protein